MEAKMTEQTKNAGRRSALLFDLCLIFALLLLAGIFLWISLSAPKGETVLVTQDGREILRVRLAEDGEYSLNGGTNFLKIEDGKAWISSAECPDKLCKKHAPISRAGEKILCLPYKITVEILGKAKPGDPDLTLFADLPRKEAEE